MKTFETEEQAVEFLQPIADSAYEKYPKGKSFGVFLMLLDSVERTVVSIGKLNEQVQNGGFAQWAYNGYNERVEILLGALMELGTETAKKTYALVNRAIDIDESLKESEEDDYDNLWEKIDDKFYNINEQLMIDLANYIQSKDTLKDAAQSNIYP